MPFAIALLVVAASVNCLGNHLFGQVFVENVADEHKQPWVLDMAWVCSDTSIA